MIRITEYSALAHANRRTLAPTVEICVVVMLVGIAVAVLVGSLEVTITRAALFEAFTMSLNPKNDLHTYYAATGTWPDPDNADQWKTEETKGGKYTVSVEHHGNGSFSILFADNEFNSMSLASKRLTIRAAIQRGVNGGPVLWFCGNASIPVYLISQGPNRTDIDNQYLPSFCRG